MSQTLYHYYERELTFIRQFAQEFAKQYPVGRRPAAAGAQSQHRSARRAADRVVRAVDRADPAQDRRRVPRADRRAAGRALPALPGADPVDGDRPVRARREPGPLPEGFTIERHSRLSTKPVGDLPCRYRTGYPVTLWPIQVAARRVESAAVPARVRARPRRTAAALRFQLETQGGRSSPHCRSTSCGFYLKGESDTVAMLYELLFNHVLEVVFRDPRAGAANPPPIVLPPEQCSRPGRLRARGRPAPLSRPVASWAIACSASSSPSRTSSTSWTSAACSGLAEAGYQNQLEILLFLDRSCPKLEQDITAETFRLGCTPVVNLFEQTGRADRDDQGQERVPGRPRRGLPGRDGGLLGRPGHERRSDRRGDHRIPAVLLAPPRHDARCGPRLLVRRAPAVGAAERPGDRGLSQPGQPGLRPDQPVGPVAGGADDLHEPRPAGHPAAGRRAADLRPGGRGAAVAHPLRAVPFAAAAASAAPGQLLAAGLAPLPQSPLAGRRRRGPRVAPGDPPALRHVRSRLRQAAAPWSSGS